MSEKVSPLSLRIRRQIVDRKTFVALDICAEIGVSYEALFKELEYMRKNGWLCSEHVPVGANGSFRRFFIIGLNEYQELAIKAEIPITSKTVIQLISFNLSWWEEKRQSEQRKHERKLRAEQGESYIELYKEKISVSIPAGKYMMGYLKRLDVLVVSKRCLGENYALARTQESAWQEMLR